MIIVYYLNNFCLQCVLWLLEELGLDYEIKFYQCDFKIMLVLFELLKVYLLGKLLVIIDGDLMVVELGNIVEYLLECYGVDSGLLFVFGMFECLCYCYWLYFVEGLVMFWLLLGLIFSKMFKVVLVLICLIVWMLFEGMCSCLVVLQIEWQMCYMEDELGKDGWFVGKSFIGVDIQMSFLVEGMCVCGGFDGCYFNLFKFFEVIYVCLVYQCVLEKGGFYELLC